MINESVIKKGDDTIDDIWNFLSFFWSGLQGPKAYSLWGGVVPSPSIGYEYLYTLALLFSLS